ncbi:MAG TPA: glycine zipper 2TM domain-containing protein [Marinagarivorans sp.]
MSLQFRAPRRLDVHPLNAKPKVNATKLKTGIKMLSLAAALTMAGAASAAGGLEQGYDRQQDYLRPGEPPSVIDTARVFSSVPVYTVLKEVTPRQSCWLETVAEERYIPAERNPHRHAPVVAGGVIGGVLGHAVGHGPSNKKLGAVVGSVLGAAVGNSVAHQRDSRPSRDGYTEVSYRDVERCETLDEVTTRRVFEGFDVTYEYLGRVYTTRMARKPGKELQLSVQFSPIER